jgi:DtxR family Mn-dependent transcriptional regulator
MPATANVPSRAAEDYLKAVYKLQCSESPVSTTALAGKLDRSAASVTNMVKSLADQGLLEHVPYHGVSLTEAGELSALLIIRRHRVIELYLIEKLGYSWDTVHAEAERLEHAVSDELVDRMAAALGDPDFDPHGAPIPTSEGTISERPLQKLLELQPGEAGVVRQVADNDSGRLLRLALGLRPGARVVREEDAPAGQPFPLNVEGEAVSLDPDLVEAVFVEQSDG